MQNFSIPNSDREIKKPLASRKSARGFFYVFNITYSLEENLSFYRLLLRKEEIYDCTTY